MSLKLKKEPIKKISRDVFAIDFNRAEQLGIKLCHDKINPIRSSSVAISMDGSLYLNTKHKDYLKLKEIYDIMSDSSTENLIKMYTLFDAKQPDINSPDDMKEFEGKAKGDAYIKLLLRYELLRREIKSAKVQPLMNLLFHEERD